MYHEIDSSMKKMDVYGYIYIYILFNISSARKNLKIDNQLNCLNFAT